MLFKVGDCFKCFVARIARIRAFIAMSCFFMPSQVVQGFKCTVTQRTVKRITARMNRLMTSQVALVGTDEITESTFPYRRGGVVIRLFITFKSSRCFRNLV